MSLWSTYRMPCRHRRSGTGRGPGALSGQGGSKGSISAHRTSSTIHGRVLTTSRNGRIVTPVTLDQGRSTRSRYELLAWRLMSQVTRPAELRFFPGQQRRPLSTLRDVE